MPLINGRNSLSGNVIGSKHNPSRSADMTSKIVPQQKKIVKPGSVNREMTATQENFSHNMSVDDTQRQQKRINSKVGRRSSTTHE